MPTCPGGHPVEEDDEFCGTCGRSVTGSAPVAVSAPGTGPTPVPAPAPAPAETAEGTACPACQELMPAGTLFCEECGHRMSEPAPPPVPEPPVTPDPPVEPETPPEPFPSQPVRRFVTAPVPEPEPHPAPPDPVPPAPVPPAPVPPQPAPPDPVPPRPHLPAGPLGAVAVVTTDRRYYEAVITWGGMDADRVRYPGDQPPRTVVLDREDIRIGRSSPRRGLQPDIDLTGPPEDIGVSHKHAALQVHGDAWTITDLDSANGTRLNGFGEPLPAGRPVPVSYGDHIYVGAWTRITLLPAGAYANHRTSDGLSGGAAAIGEEQACREP